MWWVYSGIVTYQTTFFLGHRFLAHVVSLYHSRIPWKIYILHHVMLGLKTRIIAQVLAYALTAIEREPELGTIISTTYTPWAIICLKKYNLERLTSMFSLKDDWKQCYFDFFIRSAQRVKKKLQEIILIVKPLTHFLYCITFPFFKPLWQLHQKIFGNTLGMFT